MKRFRLKVGVDVDDVLFSCSEYAIRRVNEEKNLSPPLSLDDITSWNKCETAADLRLEEFEKEEFFRTQPLLPGAKEFIQELAAITEVFLVTAVKPQFMGIRAERLLKEFPEIPEENIIMGGRKDLIHLDVILDDACHNIIRSNSAYPVLYRKPWNDHMTGCLAVNDLNEFLVLIKMIMESREHRPVRNNTKKIFVLAGPSGSGKTAIIDAFARKKILQKVPSYTTRTPREGEVNGKDYFFVSKEQFRKMKEAGEFFETTTYAGEHYGSSIRQFQECLQTENVSLAMDICGAIACKKAFPDQTVLVFVDRPKEEILKCILQRDCGNEEKVQRILSLDAEKKNETLCDEVIRNNDTLAKALGEMFVIINRYIS